MVDRTASVSGIWSLVDDSLTLLEPAPDGPAIVLVPSEQVTTAALDLPLPSRAKRAAALPFAIEDMLAEPIEQVHLALGAELAPKRHVAGAVRHSVMRGWVERLEAEGLARAALMPDALMLPLPPQGEWSVAIDGARVRIRTADGAGVAVPLAQLVAAWHAAGRPRCIACGAPLPDEMALDAADAATVAAPAALVALDLRQGAYAPRYGALPAIGRRLLGLVAIGLLAHLAIAGGDLLVLRHRVEQRRDAIRAVVARTAPGAVIGDDVATDAAALLPDAAPRAATGLLPLLSQAAAALAPLGGAAVWRGLSYSRADRTLTLQVETADMAGLQRVEQALGAAGLRPASGPAGTDNGRAQGEFTVSPAGAR